MLKKGLVIIAVPFLFQIAFVAALWGAYRESAAAQLWAIHTKDVIAQTETVARFVTQAQSDVRGLIVTGDATLSGSYEDAARRVPGAVGRLRELVADNPGQQRLVDDLAAEIVAFMAAVRETHRLAVSGDTAGASARVVALVRGRVTEKLRSRLDRFLGEEERLDGLRRSRLEQTRGAQLRAIVGGAGASLAAGAAAVLAFSRGFARRVAVLGENARRLAEGKALAAPVGGGDELSRLDAVFHAMAAALAEKDRENEMFVFSVSHDLRSPLVNLQGFSKELALSCDDLRDALVKGGVSAETLRRVDAILDRDVATSLQFIRSAVTRLSAIIDALLKLSRAGRVEYRRQPVDVAGAVARVVEALRATVAERRAEVEVVPLPPAWGDPTAVEQVFANLIGNALNYLDPARPGRVEVGSSGEIGAETTPDSNPITYYVKDNGMGIPKAYQGKLFLAFQRLHPDAAAGEGIGLALVRRVVERQGGKVWFESEEGRGSTFFFTLPAGPAGPGRSTDGPVDGNQGTRVWPTAL